MSNLLQKSLGLILLTSVCYLAPIQSAHAEGLYAYRSGSRGTITFTSRPPAGKKYWRVKPGRSRYSTIWKSKGRRWRAIPMKSQYDSMISQLAKAHKLEPALVKAVVHVESAFRAKARSHAGAQGLMQLMPATARRFGVRNPYHPPENLLGGVRYLRWLYTHFGGNVVHVLAGYNAGENAVKRYGGVPPYRETKNYVRRVLAMRDLYRCDFAGGRRNCRSGVQRL